MRELKARGVNEEKDAICQLLVATVSLQCTSIKFRPR